MSPPRLPFDAVLFDIGGTLVDQAAPGTPVAELDPVLLPGVARALAALAARLPLGAVTDTSVMTEADVRPLLARAGIDHLLGAVVTSVDVGAAKPDPRSLEEAARRLGVAPDRVLLVGDADVDRGAAEAAGAAFARVGPDQPLVPALRAALAAVVGDVDAARLLVGPADARARGAADARQLSLTKPPGSLAGLEALGRRLAGIAATCPPPLPEPAVLAVFAADHGVVASGVTPWPQEVTAQMVANVAAGGAAVSVLARRAGIEVVVVDVGVATEVPGRADLVGVRDERVRPGTADLSRGPAMTREEAARAIGVGARLAAELVGAGHRCLLTGDLGIGNTTASAALVAALTGRPAAEVTGRGTGIDDAMLATKAGVVAAAVARLAPDADALDVLAEVGGLEHAALAGFILGGAAAQVPVVVDGVIALAALLVAAALAPAVRDGVVAGHRSAEPGATAALAHLALHPVLDLGMRLGEGTGAALAQPVVAAAAAILSDMATFAEAGVGG